MSIVGSVGGTGSELMRMLPHLAGQSEGSQGTAVRGGPPAGARPPGGPPEGGAEALTDTVGTFAQAAGLDSETVESLQNQLSSAIIAALENAEESTDHGELIDDAILSTLDEYGLDAEAFLSEFKATMPTGGPAMGGMGGGPPQSDVSSQMLSFTRGDASSWSTSMSLLNTFA